MEKKNIKELYELNYVNKENNCAYINVRKNCFKKFEEMRSGDPCFDIAITEDIANELKISKDYILITNDELDRTGYPDIYDTNIIVHFELENEKEIYGKNNEIKLKSEKLRDEIQKRIKDIESNWNNEKRLENIFRDITYLCGNDNFMVINFNDGNFQVIFSKSCKVQFEISVPTARI